MSSRSKSHEALGRAVREVRTKRGLTQEQVSKASGIAPTYISDIERGVRNPSYTTMVRLAAALETSVGEMATLADELRD